MSGHIFTKRKRNYLMKKSAPVRKHTKHGCSQDQLHLCFQIFNFNLTVCSLVASRSLAFKKKLVNHSLVPKFLSQLNEVRITVGLLC